MFFDWAILCADGYTAMFENMVLNNPDITGNYTVTRFNYRIFGNIPNKPLISHGLEKDKKWIIIIPKRRKYGILKSQGIAPHFPF